MVLKYLNHLKKEMGDEFRRLLTLALEKCDLVTREEFDIQTAVLNKTRDKFQKLEELLTTLETKLEKKPENFKN